MKENESVSEPVTEKEETQTNSKSRREKRIIGLIVCLIGIVCLLIWGIVSIFLPSAADQIGTSSMITINGNGIFLIICLTAIIAGAVLLLKSSSDK